MLVPLISAALLATVLCQNPPIAQPIEQSSQGAKVLFQEEAVAQPPQVFFQAQATSSENLDPCQYLLQNLTTVESLQQHEFASLEQCLYYYLAGESAKKMQRYGIPHPIAAVPPNYITKQPVNVRFHLITLQHFELNEFLKDVSIHGYMDINWEDDRLQWEKSRWKMDKLQIQSLSHIWYPIFIAQKYVHCSAKHFLSYETALKNGDAFEMRKVETSNDGNVSAIIAFSLHTFCDDSDFENYPDDVYKCCFNLEPHLNTVCPFYEHVL